MLRTFAVTCLYQQAFGPGRGGTIYFCSSLCHRGQQLLFLDTNYYKPSGIKQRCIYSQSTPLIILIKTSSSAKSLLTLVLCGCLYDDIISSTSFFCSTTKYLFIFFHAWDKKSSHRGYGDAKSELSHGRGALVSPQPEADRRELKMQQKDQIQNIDKGLFIVEFLIWKKHEASSDESRLLLFFPVLSKLCDK